MPLNVYSKVLANEVGWNGFKEYFVPLGFVWVVTDVTSYGEAHSGDKFFLQDLVTRGAWYAITAGGTLTGPHYDHWVGRHVIGPQEISFVEGFCVQTAGAAKWDFYVSGYELTLP